ATLRLIPSSKNFAHIRVPLDNAGVVRAEGGGTLYVEDGGTGTGQYVVDAGSGLSIAGTHTFTPSSSIGGAGSVSFAGPTTVAGRSSVSRGTGISGNVAFTGPVNIAGSTLYVNNGTADFTQAAGPADAAALYLNNATLLLGTNLTITGPDTLALPADI